MSIPLHLSKCQFLRLESELLHRARYYEHYHGRDAETLAAGVDELLDMLDEAAGKYLPQRENREDHGE